MRKNDRPKVIGTGKRGAYGKRAGQVKGGAPGGAQRKNRGRKNSAYRFIFLIVPRNRRQPRRQADAWPLFRPQKNVFRKKRPHRKRILLKSRFLRPREAFCLFCAVFSVPAQKHPQKRQPGGRYVSAARLLYFHSHCFNQNIALFIKQLPSADFSAAVRLVRRFTSAEAVRYSAKTYPYIWYCFLIYILDL